MSFCKYSLRVCSLFSNSLDIFFSEVFNFSSIQLINYFCHWWSSIPISQGYLDLSLLSSRSFISLHLTFRSVTHYELIFVNVFYLRSTFRFFSSGYPAVSTSFVEKTIFDSLYYLCSVVKDQLTIYVGLFLSCQLCSIDLFICSFTTSMLFGLM